MPLPSAVEVRPSRPEDADALLGVWRRAVDTSHEFLSAEDRAAIDPLVADYVRSTKLTVATLDQAPVAFMGTSGATIDSLFIDPRGQGLGIGRLLIDRVERPTMVDVNEQNEPGLAFYRHLGFSVVGRSDTDGDGRPYPLLHLRRD